MTISPTPAKRPECKHDPRDLIAAFYHVCRGCGLPIAPVLCEECDGSGLSHPAARNSGPCPACNGTGVERWSPTL